MDLCDIVTLRALLKRHGFRFSKSRGQNFLVDAQAMLEIAAASEADRSCGVLEIGPGAGALTMALAARAGKVAAVELDLHLLPVLAETVGNLPNVEVIPGDALKLDLDALAREKFPGLTPVVCANLPYNITTPLLERLIDAKSYHSFTVLVQKEVAERLAAPAGSGDGGAFALYLQYYMTPELLFPIPWDHFYPAPKVDSALLRCVRREKPAVEVEDETFFFQVVRGAFLLRRKTLANSLSAALPAFTKERIQDALAAVGLHEAIRGERLTLENFADLCRALRANTD